MTNDPKEEYEQSVEELDDAIPFDEAIRRVIEGIESGDYNLKHGHYPWTDENPQVTLDTGEGVTLTTEDHCLKTVIKSVIGTADMTESEVLDELQKYVE